MSQSDRALTQTLIQCELERINGLDGEFTVEGIARLIDHGVNIIHTFPRPSSEPRRYSGPSRYTKVVSRVLFKSGRFVQCSERSSVQSNRRVIRR